MAPVKGRVVISTAFASLIEVLVVAVGLLSCGTPTPPNSIAGTWTGTVTDSLGRQGTASLSLTDDRHAILQGDFSYFASECSSNSKSVTGKISGTQISLVQSPPNPVPTSLQLAVDATDQHLAGSYSDTSSGCSSSGLIDLMKPVSN